MKAITVEELIFMDAVLSGNGNEGEARTNVVNSAALKQCLEFPFVVVAGADWFSTDVEKAAALAEVFSARQRLAGFSLSLGLMLGCLLLQKNGYEIAASAEEVQIAATNLAMRTFTHETLVSWYERHSSKPGEETSGKESDEAPS